MTGVDLTADQATVFRAEDNGKDQSWPRAAADSSRPRKESLLQSSTRTLASQAAQCSPTVPCPLNSLWGTGTARLLGFSRGSRLRSFDHIGSSRSAKSPARYPAIAASGPLLDVLVDLHGVKAPGEATRV